MPASNTTPATAIDMGALPYTITVDAPIDTSEALWWSYTAVADDRMISFRQNVSDAATVIPFTMAYFGTPSNLTNKIPLAVQGENKIITIGVTPGVTYFFRVKDANASGPNSGTLTVASISAPVVGASAGNLFVPTDTFNVGSDGSFVPSLVMDKDTGEVLFAAPDVLACERGAVLPNGNFLILDLNVGEFYLYDLTPALITKVPGFDTSFNFEAPVTSNRDDLFYVCFDHIVREIDGTTGAPTGNTWDIGTTPRNMVVSLDSSLLLYQADTSGAAILAWDLLTDTSAGTWAPGVTGRVALKEAVNMADGTFVFGFYKSSVTQLLTIKHYDASGNVLSSFDVDPGGSSSSVPRIAHTLEDVDTIWVRIFNPSPDIFATEFTEVELAAGAIVRDWTVQARTYWGYIDPDDPTAYIFGPEHSCPMWALPVPMGEVTPPPTGTLIILKETDPEGSPQAFDFSVGPDLSPATFTLADGESQEFADIPVGTYSVAEGALPDGWTQTSIVVSNADPPDAIEIGDGDTVTVTVTNTFNGGEPCPGERGDPPIGQ